jgi:hypothetical protein
VLTGGLRDWSRTLSDCLISNGFLRYLYSPVGSQVIALGSHAFLLQTSPLLNIVNDLVLPLLLQLTASMSKLLVVVGATGGQGGSVLKAMREHSRHSFKIRGITRNTNSGKAKALSAQGIEMVAADLNDESSLVQAFQGASAIFAVKDFYETFRTGDPWVARTVSIDMVSTWPEQRSRYLPSTTTSGVPLRHIRSPKSDSLCHIWKLKRAWTNSSNNLPFSRRRPSSGPHSLTATSSNQPFSLFYSSLLRS